MIRHIRTCDHIADAKSCHTVDLRKCSHDNEWLGDFFFDQLHHTVTIWVIDKFHICFINYSNDMLWNLTDECLQLSRVDESSGWIVRIYDN